MTEKQLSSAKKPGAIRRYMVDTASSTVFFFAFGAAVELGASGMSMQQFLKARAIAAAGSIIVSRPYGIYRDFIFRKVGANENSGFLRKAAADTFAFTTGILPTYAATLALAGTNGKSMAIALGINAVVGGAIGRPLGAWMDFVRRSAGLEPATSLALRK